MPLIDTSSPTLTAEQAEAYLMHSSKARIVAVQQVSELERAEHEKIPDEVWQELFQLWRKQTRSKNLYQEHKEG
jgi:hypothetical protein